MLNSLPWHGHLITPAETVAETVGILAARAELRWGPDRLGPLLGHRRLADIDRPTRIPVHSHGRRSFGVHRSQHVERHDRCLREVRPDVHLEEAGFHPKTEAVIGPEGEFVVAEIEVDGPTFASRKTDATEGHQASDRLGARGDHISNEDEDDLVAIAVTRISDRGPHGDASSSAQVRHGDLRGDDLRGSVLEGAVGQPMPELELRSELVAEGIGKGARFAVREWDQREHPPSIRAYRPGGTLAELPRAASGGCRT